MHAVSLEESSVVKMGSMEATPHVVVPLASTSAQLLTGDRRIESIVVVTLAGQTIRIWAQMADRAVLISAEGGER